MDKWFEIRQMLTNHKSYVNMDDYLSVPLAPPHDAYRASLRQPGFYLQLFSKKCRLTAIKIAGSIFHDIYANFRFEKSHINF
jgi:hypothetical protein